MSEGQPRVRTFPGVYALFVHGIARRAREVGYCIAVHGSLARDLDLVAVPWVEEAIPAEELAQLVAMYLGGTIETDWGAQPGDFSKRNPQPKPHGRLAYSIQLGGGPYVDLSVMPRSFG